MRTLRKGTDPSCSKYEVRFNALPLSPLAIPVSRLVKGGASIVLYRRAWYNIIVTRVKVFEGGINIDTRS